MFNNKNNLNFATLTIHGDKCQSGLLQQDDCNCDNIENKNYINNNAVIDPMYLSTLYKYKEFGQEQEYTYSRIANPTRDAYEKCVATLESGKFACAFASGVASINAILELLDCDDHIIATNNIYGGTSRLFKHLQHKRNLNITYVDMIDNIDNIILSINAKTKMIWVETPSNPLLKIIDLEAIGKIGKQYNLITVCDNTFATPYLQQPFNYNFDIVMHSVTKYLNGHSDVLGGIVVINDNQGYAEALRTFQKTCGAVASPFDCYMTLRGIRTLALRMQRHCENAYSLANWLEHHSSIEHVYYPGLLTNPQHALAKQQMSAFGGVISCVLKGNIDNVKRFFQATQLFPLTESLGGVESLASHPATMSHSSISYEERQTLGIVDNLIRLSVGIEDFIDLRNDLDKALKFACS